MPRDGVGRAGFCSARHAHDTHKTQGQDTQDTRPIRRAVLPSGDSSAAWYGWVASCGSFLPIQAWRQILWDEAGTLYGCSSAWKYPVLQIPSRPAAVSVLKEVLVMAMRRANGSGNVFKMKGNRHKPWRGCVTVGWTEDGKQMLKNIGYFESRKEADKALADYLSCPYDLTASQMTFKELYELWFGEYWEKLSGVSSERTIRPAFSYCSSLYQMK